VTRPHFLALLADALRKAHKSEEGLGVLEEALELAHRNGERCYLAELYRLKGELLVMQATGSRISRAAVGGRAEVTIDTLAAAEAEACFNESIKIAQQQKAKSWELRAVVSLARVYQKQNKQQEALNLLAQIYDTFTEGFNTVDLREAKDMLKELS